MEEGQCSASSKFIPSVYEGNALPANQAEHTPADTHTAVRFNHLRSEGFLSKGWFTCTGSFLFQLDATRTGV